jgi:hypothetical protein
MTAISVLPGSAKPTECSRVLPFGVVTVSPSASKVLPPTSTNSTSRSPSSCSRAWPDPDDVALGHPLLGDAPAVDERAVAAAQVGQRPAAGGVCQDGVPAGDEQVVEDDVAVGQAADRDARPAHGVHGREAALLRHHRPAATGRAALERQAVPSGRPLLDGRGAAGGGPQLEGDPVGGAAEQDGRRRTTSRRLIRSPCRKVPLRLRSCSVQPPAPGSSTRCSRETRGWSRSRSTPAPRPTTNRRAGGTT